MDPTIFMKASVKTPTSFIFMNLVGKFLGTFRLRLKTMAIDRFGGLEHLRAPAWYRVKELVGV